MELMLLVFLVGYFCQHIASLVLIQKILEKKSVEGGLLKNNLLFS